MTTKCKLNLKEKKFQVLLYKNNYKLNCITIKIVLKENDNYLERQSCLLYGRCSQNTHN